MNQHSSSSDDVAFRAAFEASAFPPQDFGHRAHVRLAYVYLTEGDVETAVERLRAALFGFLDHHGVDRSKYHETMTRAWIMAVRHFMERNKDPIPRYHT